MADAVARFLRQRLLGIALAAACLATIAAGLRSEVPVANDHLDLLFGEHHRSAAGRDDMAP